MMSAITTEFRDVLAADKNSGDTARQRRVYRALERRIRDDLAQTDPMWMSETLADFRHRYPGFVQHWIPRHLAPPGFRTINPPHRSAVPISTLKPRRFRLACALRSPWPSIGSDGCSTMGRTCRYSYLGSRLTSLSRCRLRATLRATASCGGHPCTTGAQREDLRPPPRP